MWCQSCWEIMVLKRYPGCLNEVTEMCGFILKPINSRDHQRIYNVCPILNIPGITITVISTEYISGEKTDQSQVYRDFLWSLQRATPNFKAVQCIVHDVHQRTNLLVSSVVAHRVFSLSTTLSRGGYNDSGSNSWNIGDRKWKKFNVLWENLIAKHAGFELTPKRWWASGNISEHLNFFYIMAILYIYSQVWDQKVQVVLYQTVVCHAVLLQICHILHRSW